MERDYYFDNYKAFLIFLVVIGHFLHPLQEEVLWTEYLRKVIFIFHMPAFVFISGYFARRNDWRKLVQKLLLPYLLMQICIWLLREATSLPDKEFSLIRPYFTLWFLPCLFCWRLIIEKAAKIKGGLALSFVIGILAGFIGAIDQTLSLSRMICFFPYFLLGYQFDKEGFMKYAGRREVKLLAVVGIGAVFLLLAVLNSQLAMEAFLFRRGYPAGNQLGAAGTRLFLYAGGTLLTYLFAILMPLGKHWFSVLGARTMSVYLYHGIFVQFFENSSLIPSLANNAGAVFVILFAILLTLFLAWKPFSRLAAALASLPVEKLLAAWGSRL